MAADGASRVSLVASEASSLGRGHTEIASASIVCGTCDQRCRLTARCCDVCEAAPRLKVGGYSFMGAKKTLYDASKGPALSNSVVFLGRAKGPADDEPSEADGEAGEEDIITIAMKTVPLDSEPDSVEMARREIQVFQSLGSRHPNLLPLLYGAETESELVLLTPYAPGGDLYKLTNVAGGAFKCLEEQDASHLASQILTGLAALHGQRIMHGDIKPHNVFLTHDKAEGSFVAQLGDFGLSRYVASAEGVPSEGGTPGYMAPEMVGWREGTARPLVSFGADLFAFGIMQYELLSSMSPFDPPSNVRAPLEFEDDCWEPLAPQVREFVRILLAKQAEDRSTAEDLLNHPWIDLGAAAERGRKRSSYAPSPADKLRFMEMSKVWEIFGTSPQEYRTPKRTAMKSPCLNPEQNPQSPSDPDWSL